MVEALHVANNILACAFKDKEDVTPMKLQKLLYFTYKEYLKKTNTPLFGERFEAWRYGPVAASVYNQFKKYGSKHIKDYYTDCNGEIWVVAESKNLVFKQALDCVWKRYSGYDGITLSALTHAKDTAWYKAMQNGEMYLNDEDITVEEWLK